MESLGRCGRSCEAPAYASGEKVAASRGGQGGGATTSTLRPVLGATGSRQAQAGVQTSAVSATPRPIYDSCLHTRAGAGAKGSETGSRPPGPLKCVWNQWPAGPGSAPASRSPLEEQLPHHKQEPEQRRPPSGRRASAPAASSTFGCQPAPAAVVPHLREPQAAARSRGCVPAQAREGEVCLASTHRCPPVTGPDVGCPAPAQVAFAVPCGWARVTGGGGPRGALLNAVLAAVWHCPARADGLLTALPTSSGRGRAFPGGGPWRVATVAVLRFLCPGSGAWR